MAPVYTLTRRRFLKAAAVASATPIVAGCPRPNPGGGPVTVFRRSARGRRVSRAAKKHAANHLYATMEAALFDLAHPGDNSYVVQVKLSRAKFQQYFRGGRTSVDLRHVQV